MAELIGADPRGSFFTSGATESNNLAIKGIAHFYAGRGKHIVTSKTEHKAVLDTLPPTGAGRRGDLPRAHAQRPVHP